MADERQKINIHSLADLKNTTDDAIPHYLNSIGYRQIHTLTDVRLAISSAACIIAAGTFYYDFKFGFEAAKTLTLYAVSIYFILNTVLTWWIWGVEAGTFYEGEKDGVRVTLSSATEKHSPYYHIKIKTTGKNISPDRSHIVEAKEPFTSWFDEQGYLVPQPLKNFLNKTIPDLAAKNLVTEAKKLQGQKKA